VSSDDYAQLEKTIIGLKNFLIYPERPILYFYMEFQNWLIGENYIAGSFYVFFSNLIIVSIVFYIFEYFINNKKISLFLTLLYSLYFSKVEIFHYPTFVHVNLVSSLYLLSILNFLYFIKYKHFKNYIISFVSYSFAIFWYEIGYLLPIVFFIYFVFNLKFFKLKKIINIFLPFALIIMFALTYRLTNAFGFSEAIIVRSINFFSLIGFVDVFNILIGRSFLKNLIYGLFSFYNYSLMVTTVLVILNFFFVIYLYKLINDDIYKLKLYKFNNLVFFISLLIITLIPNILVGSIGGRNLIIPLISIVYLVYLILISIKINFKIIMILFLIAMIVNQGNNFSQVIASKINHSINEAIHENNENIIESENIVFDIQSLKNNIPYTLVNNKLNNFNYYFGAQVFEDWGLHAMLRRYSDFSDQNIYIASSEIKVSNQNLNFLVTNITGYNQGIFEIKNIPMHNTFIIDYDTIYPNGFSF
tara:strand:+ start:6944 stop:8365 length:1422 start_codon:yes stop_codon:yes gene_type:complete